MTDIEVKTVYETIAKRCAERRASLRISQADLAAHADVDISTIKDLESFTKQRALKLDTLLKITDALGVSIGWLMGDNEHTKIQSPEESQAAIKYAISILQEVEQWNSKERN